MLVQCPSKWDEILFTNSIGMSIYFQNEIRTNSNKFSNILEYHTHTHLTHNTQKNRKWTKKSLFNVFNNISNTVHNRKTKGTCNIN